MNNLFPQISEDVLVYLVKFLSINNEEKYWQNIYKEKFSKFILPDINQGWKLVGINQYVFCDYCMITKSTDINCCNCHMTLPCANCYSFGICPEESCSAEFQLISWKNMKGLLFDDIEYKNYEDFIQKNKKL